MSKMSDQISVSTNDTEFRIPGQDASESAISCHRVPTKSNSLLRLVSCGSIASSDNDASKLPRDVQLFRQQSNESGCSSTGSGYKIGDYNPSSTAMAPHRSNLVTAFEWIVENDKNDAQCIGTKHLKEDGTYGPFEWLSRRQYLDECLYHAEGLRHMLNKFCPVDTFEDMHYYPETDDASLTKLRIVGIAMKNSYEWALLEYVAQLLGIVLVPLYGTLGSAAISAIIQETRMQSIFVDPSTLSTMLKACEGEENILPKNIIITVSPKDKIAYEYLKVADLVTKVKAFGCEVSFLSDLRSNTKIDNENRYVWKPDEIWTLSYTSGTTGRPKGAMLTERSILTVTYDIMKTYNSDEGIFGIDPKYLPTYFSYLPLAHILERSCMNTILLMGHRLAFFSGDVPRLFDEIKEAGATLLMCVPRVLERLQMKVMDAIQQKSGVVQYLFDKALRSKVSNHQKTGHPTHGLWDMAVMNKLKAQIVGPQLKSIICGGAPLSTEIREDVQAMLSAKVVIGYGLTESCGAIFVQHTSDVCNTIGWVMKSAHAKLVDVPELGYKSAEGRGELLVKGHAVFKGYFRNPEVTKEAFTEDDWFRTGDVAQFDVENGGASIIDRAKNCFKLAQGEYIAPEKIENILKVASSVDQVVVLGNTSETKCVALVSLSEGFVEASGKSGKELLKDKTIHQRMISEMTEKAKEQKLFGFEIPKLFIFIERPLLPDDGLHTPTLKVKRPIFNKKFKQAVDHLYVINDNIAIDIDGFIKSDDSDFKPFIL